MNAHRTLTAAFLTATALMVGSAPASAMQADDFGPATTERERGIVLECRGEAGGSRPTRASTRTTGTGTSCRSCSATPTPATAGRRSRSARCWRTAAVRGTITIDGAKARIRGTAVKVGKKKPVHEVHDDAGYLITVDGTHKRLADRPGADLRRPARAAHLRPVVRLRPAGHEGRRSSDVREAVDGVSGRGDHGRDPDPVVRRTAHRQPGHLGHGRPDPGDPVEVADGVLRQPAAPPLHVGVDRAPRSARPRRRGRPATAATSSSSVRCSDGLLAVPAERGAQVHEAGLGARPPHPVPLGERERRGLDRPAVDRRHQEAGGRRRAPVTSATRKAKVTTAIEAYSIPASSAAATGASAPSSRAVGAAGVARTTASASTRSGADAGPTVEDEAGRRCGASSRTVAPRRTSSAAASASVSPPMPAGHARRRPAGRTVVGTCARGRAPSPGAPGRPAGGRRPGPRSPARGRRRRRRAAARRAGR